MTSPELTRATNLDVKPHSLSSVRRKEREKQRNENKSCYKSAVLQPTSTHNSNGDWIRGSVSWYIRSDANVHVCVEVHSFPLSVPIFVWINFSNRIAAAVSPYPFYISRVATALQYRANHRRNTKNTCIWHGNAYATNFLLFMLIYNHVIL
jgi:hypothetical protein